MKKGALLRFPPKSSKRICKFSLEVLENIRKNDIKTFSSEQLRWFYPIFSYSLSLDSITEKNTILNTIDIIVNTILKNEANFDRDFYLEHFVYSFEALEAYFENKSIKDDDKVKLNKFISKIVLSPLFELNQNCYFAASKLIIKIMDSLDVSHHKITTMNTAFFIISNKLEDVSLAIKTTKILKESAISIDETKKAWNELINATVDSFIYDTINDNIFKNNIFLVNSCTPVLEFVSYFIESFKHHSLKYEGNKIFTSRPPHNFILSLIAEKFKGLETSELFKTADLLLETDMDSKSKWIDVILAEINSREEEYVESINVLNKYLLTFPKRTLPFAITIIKKISEKSKLAKKVGENFYLFLANTVAASKGNNNYMNILFTAIPLLIEFSPPKPNFFTYKLLHESWCYPEFITYTSSSYKTDEFKLLALYMGEFDEMFARFIPKTKLFPFLLSLVQNESIQSMIILYIFTSNIKMPDDVKNKVRDNIDAFTHKTMLKEIFASFKEANGDSFKYLLKQANEKDPYISKHINKIYAMSVEEAKQFMRSTLVNVFIFYQQMLIKSIIFFIESNDSSRISSEKIQELMSSEEEKLNIRVDNKLITFINSDDLIVIARNATGNIAYQIKDNKQNNENIAKRATAFLLNTFMLYPESKSDISCISEEIMNDFDSLESKLSISIAMYELSTESTDIFDNREMSKKSLNLLRALGKKTKHTMKINKQTVNIEEDVRMIETSFLKIYIYAASRVPEHKPRFAILFSKKRPMRVNLDDKEVDIIFSLYDLGDNIYSMEVHSKSLMFGIDKNEIIIRKEQITSMISLYIYAYLLHNSPRQLLEEVQLRNQFINAKKNASPGNQMQFLEMLNL